MRARAGLVEWFNVSFPSWKHGFNSRIPLAALAQWESNAFVKQRSRVRISEAAYLYRPNYDIIRTNEYKKRVFKISRQDQLPIFKK